MLWMAAACNANCCSRPIKWYATGNPPCNSCGCCTLLLADVFAEGELAVVAAAAFFGERLEDDAELVRRRGALPAAPFRDDALKEEALLACREEGEEGRGVWLWRRSCLVRANLKVNPLLQTFFWGRDEGEG